VRQDATTPVPALAWGAAPPHENAVRGQNNAVFCRVRNRGAAAASVVYVRALLTHWAGLEFVYSADFEPSTNVGAPLPNPLVPGTYLIGEARIDNLAVGADQIVKFTWPQALVPPDTVVVNGANVTSNGTRVSCSKPPRTTAPIRWAGSPCQWKATTTSHNATSPSTMPTMTIRMRLSG
jgi:hypothetical protein